MIHFGFCLGYISGVTDEMRVEKSICMSEGVATAATVQAFINWATGHPDKWNLYRLVGVRSALTGAWPCKVE